jgi:hypothetical protein
MPNAFKTAVGGCCCDGEVFENCSSCLSAITGISIAISGANDYNCVAPCSGKGAGWSGAAEVHSYSNMNGSYALTEYLGLIGGWRHFRIILAAGNCGDPGILLISGCTFTSAGVVKTCRTYLYSLTARVTCTGSNLIFNIVGWGEFGTLTTDGVCSSSTSTCGGFNPLIAPFIPLTNSTVDFDSACNGAGTGSLTDSTEHSNCGGLGSTVTWTFAPIT